MSRYVVERTQDGSLTLRSLELDQACHSSCGAWLEARERYAVPCGVHERARNQATVRVLDIGTGPGWNVAALLAATATTEARVELISLELDREVFELGNACVQDDESGGGEWLAEARLALRASALQDGATAPWSSASQPGNVRLIFGDARQTLAALPVEDRFDVVFLDPFSPASSPELWEPDFLAEIARRMNSGALLSTYTTSLAVRVGLRAAGLAVGPGARVGEKHQGTLAGRDVVLDPFDSRTTRKLQSRLDRLGLAPS